MSASECDRTERHRPSLDDRMRGAILAHVGWGYSKLKPSFIWPIPGVKGAGILLVDKGHPARTNCSSFALSVLVRALEIEHFGSARYERAQIFDLADRRGPVDAWAEHLAETAPSSSLGWWICQGWRTYKTGHTFLVRSTPAGLLIVEANDFKDYLVKGTGVRGVGPLDEAGAVLDADPVAAGWSTWDHVRATYRELYVGRLKD